MKLLCATSVLLSVSGCLPKSAFIVDQRDAQEVCAKAEATKDQDDVTRAICENAFDPDLREPSTITVKQRP